METDTIALFHINMHGGAATIGYTFLGDEFVEFHRRFPHFNFTITKCSAFDSLSAFLRLSEKNLRDPKISDILVKLHDELEAKITQGEMTKSNARHIIAESIGRALAKRSEGK